MSSLYNIDQSILELLDKGFNENCIDFETGEISYEKADQYLSELNIERKAKLENIALYIKNLESEAEAIKQEEQNLKARRVAKEAKVEQLKNYISNSMIVFNEQRFETARVAMSFRTSKVVDVDMKRLDKQYIREKVEYAPDKQAIKEAIASGKEVAGAVLKENRNLQIK